MKILLSCFSIFVDADKSSQPVAIGPFPFFSGEDITKVKEGLKEDQDIFKAPEKFKEPFQATKFFDKSFGDTTKSCGLDSLVDEMLTYGKNAQRGPWGQFDNAEHQAFGKKQRFKSNRMRRNYADKVVYLEDDEKKKVYSILRGLSDVYDILKERHVLWACGGAKPEGSEDDCPYRVQTADYDFFTYVACVIFPTSDICRVSEVKKAARRLKKGARPLLDLGIGVYNVLDAGAGLMLRRSFLQKASAEPDLTNPFPAGVDMERLKVRIDRQYSDPIKDNYNYLKISLIYKFQDVVSFEFDSLKTETDTFDRRVSFYYFQKGGPPEKGTLEILNEKMRKKSEEDHETEIIAPRGNTIVYVKRPDLEKEVSRFLIEACRFKLENDGVTEKTKVNEKCKIRNTNTGEGATVVAGDAIDEPNSDLTGGEDNALVRDAVPVSERQVWESSRDIKFFGETLQSKEEPDHAQPVQFEPITIRRKTHNSQSAAFLQSQTESVQTSSKSGRNLRR